MKYVLVLVFSPDMKDTLLILRNREPYKDLLNSPGGKIEDGENKLTAVIRELNEETGLQYKDGNLRTLLIQKFPNSVQMAVYYFRLYEDHLTPPPIREGRLMWYPTRHCLDVTNPIFAGDGNLAYFINYAIKAEGVNIYA